MHANFKNRLLIKISLAAGTVLAIIAAVFAVAYDISAKTQYIFTTRAEIKSRLDSINQLALLRTSLAEAGPSISKLERALPPEDSLLIISRDIENAARRHNLGYSFKFVGVKKEVSENIWAIDFQANAQGDYQGIRNFLKDMETLPYFITVLDTDIIIQQKGVYNSSVHGLIHFNNG